jgi:predicted DsbA family dithiol-disulfide isomerase
LFGRNADIPGAMRRLKMRMDAEGIPFDAGRYMTFNSRLAQELAKWGEGKPKSNELNMALYQSYFVDGRNIGEVEVLVSTADQLGLPVDEVREVLGRRLMRAAVDADWQYANSIGVTAVPTFAVGRQGIVGAQPYEQLARFLENVGATER